MWHAEDCVARSNGAPTPPATASASSAASVAHADCDSTTSSSRSDQNISLAVGRHWHHTSPSLHACIVTFGPSAAVLYSGSRTDVSPRCPAATLLSLPLPLAQANATLTTPPSFLALTYVQMFVFGLAQRAQLGFLPAVFVACYLGLSLVGAAPVDPPLIAPTPTTPAPTTARPTHSHRPKGAGPTVPLLAVVPVCFTVACVSLVLLVSVGLLVMCYASRVLITDRQSIAVDTDDEGASRTETKRLPRPSPPRPRRRLRANRGAHPRTTTPRWPRPCWTISRWLTKRAGRLQHLSMPTRDQATSLPSVILSTSEGCPPWWRRPRRTRARLWRTPTPTVAPVTSCQSALSTWSGRPRRRLICAWRRRLRRCRLC